MPEKEELESIKKESLQIAVILKMKNAQNRNRTSDTRIFSPLLYQLSYLGIYKTGARILLLRAPKLRGQDLNL